MAQCKCMQMKREQQRGKRNEERDEKRNEKTGQRKRSQDRFNMFSRGYSQKEIAAISSCRVQKMCEGFIENTTMAVHTS